MDDITHCPMCGAKMRNLHMKDKFFRITNKTSNFVERSCHNGKNHYLWFVADVNTKQIDYLKFSLDPKYSKSIEINFIYNKCIINFLKDKSLLAIQVPKIIDPDFPDLIKLKQQTNLYCLFS